MKRKTQLDRAYLKAKEIIAKGELSQHQAMLEAGITYNAFKRREMRDGISNQVQPKPKRKVTFIDLPQAAPKQEKQVAVIICPASAIADVLRGLS